MSLKENKTKSQMSFEILESITKKQRDISNWLLLYASEKTVRKSKSFSENKKRRRQQLNDYKKAIMLDFKYSADFKTLTFNYWSNEIKWYKNQLENFGSTILINALLYRLQVVFFQNHNHCIFYEETTKGRKSDDKEFITENQKLFIKFLNQSIKIISSEKKFKQIIDILLPLKNLKQIDITEKVFSASHKLFGKDWNIIKGVFVGGGTGIVASLFLGPVIGGYIGNLAGFSGAAATSYGLALLGGGSIASGGFGMAGGSFILGLGLGFGLSNGIRGGIKGFNKDKLNQMHIQACLPSLLAIGRLQFENGDKKIPKLIYKTISKRFKEQEKRLKQLEKNLEKKEEQFRILKAVLDKWHDDYSIKEQEIKTIKQSITVVKKSVKLYKKAKNMSLSYSWATSYDQYKKVKKWLS